MSTRVSSVAQYRTPASGSLGQQSVSALREGIERMFPLCSDGREGPARCRPDVVLLKQRAVGQRHLATERLARGPRDLDRHDVARGRKAVEVHDFVVRGSSA
jgi:hypothetical protein